MHRLSSEMELADLLPARFVRVGSRQPAPPDVAVLEDQRQLADLAVELCARLGLRAVPFSSSSRYNAAFRDRRPRLVILDWRLEHEVAAAVYMGLRHRHDDLPVVVWTATGEHDLPPMVATHPYTCVVQKASAIETLEAAIRWAAATPPEGGGDAP